MRAAYTYDEGKLEVDVFAAINVIGRDYLVRYWHVPGYSFGTRGGSVGER